MITHTNIYYESFDGMIFMDELKCLEHELNVLYTKSGIKLFDKAYRLIEYLDIDKSYDQAEFIRIDREKKEDNNKFAEAANDICGWCLIKDAYNGKEELYRLKIDGIEPFDAASIL